MDFTTINTSVVLIVQDYNPSTLNHDFLLAAGIAEDDWGLVEPPVSTPVVSSVKYSNGYVFLSEINKIQISDTGENQILESSKVNQLMDAIVDRFPYIRYTAVGINSMIFFETENSEQFIAQKFIKQGIWLDGLSTSSINFVYMVNDARLNLKVDSGSRIQDNARGIIVNANYHVAVSSGLTLQDSVKKVKETLASTHSYYKHFSDTVNNMFGG